MNCYRVWMKDGYAGLYNGKTEEDARQQAIAAAQHAIEGLARSPGERRAATTVDYAECLTEANHAATPALPRCSICGEVLILTNTGTYRHAPKGIAKAKLMAAKITTPAEPTRGKRLTPR